MRFLADESCDFAVVRCLRQAGHDVSSIVESYSGSEDEFVIKLAKKEKRILLTEDKDFGHLVFVRNIPSTGVILLRFSPEERDNIGRKIVDFIKLEGKKLKGSFIVIQPNSVRIRRLPT